MNDQSLKAAARRALPPEVQEGALLAGRYRIGRMLGSGGMGAVLAAEHVELNEPVAIKVLLRDAATQASPEALGRFTREAWAASKIKSEYVARVSDLGRLDDGTPYIVMEYLDGVDLEGLLLSHEQLELEQALELMLQACEALAEAHALGIFHRDLKPSNLFCIQRSDGLMAIKLLDFGISKIAPAAASFGDLRLTATASTLGTPLYMAPEQMRSGRVADERSDIWALGVILYEMLAGDVPFNAENLADLAVRVATELPASITAQRADVPAELERVVMRCLEKDSARRFQTVAELARALAPFAPPRAAAHAERAERILLSQRSQPGKVSIVSTSDRSTPQVSATRTTLSSAGSHARLRANSAQTLSVRKPTPRSRAIAGAVAAALLLVLVAAVVLRRGAHSATTARNQQPAVPSETRAHAAVVQPAGPTEARSNAAVGQPAAASPAATVAVTTAAVEPAQPTPQHAPPAPSAPGSAARVPAASPATAPPGSRAASEPPPSAASPAARAATTPKRARPSKPAPPTASGASKDSELDSLGGRL